MSSKREIGNVGEEAAALYLTEQGYKIIARNFTIRGGEIDIIAAKGDVIAFVEVKSRDAGGISTGVEAVTAKKRRFIIKTAEAFMSKSNIDLQPRFDVADVKMASGQVTDITYIENAFDASGYDAAF